MAKIERRQLVLSDARKLVARVVGSYSNKCADSKDRSRDILLDKKSHKVPIDSTFGALPIEVKEHVFSYLNPTDLCSLRQVDRHTGAIATHALEKQHSSAIFQSQLRRLSLLKGKKQKRAEGWSSTSFGQACAQRLQALKLNSYRCSKDLLEPGESVDLEKCHSSLLLTKNLQKLHLREMDALSTEVTHTIAQLRNLKFLRICQASPRDHVLQPLARMTGLEGLSLNGFGKENVASFLRSSPKIRFLELSEGPRPCHEEMRAVTNLKSLTDLDLSDRNLQDSDLEQLLDAKHLVRLDISKNHLSNSCLKSISKIASLEQFIGNWLGITDIGISDLNGMHSLKTVYLPSATLSDKGLSFLFDMPNLRYVRIGRGTLTIEAAQNFCDKKIILRHFGAGSICNYIAPRASLRLIPDGSALSFGSQEGVKTIYPHIWSAAGTPSQ